MADTSITKTFIKKKTYGKVLPELGLLVLVNDGVDASNVLANNMDLRKLGWSTTGNLGNLKMNYIEQPKGDHKHMI